MNTINKLMKTLSEKVNPRVGVAVSLSVMLVATVLLGAIQLTKTANVQVEAIDEPMVESFIFIEEYDTYELNDIIEGYLDGDNIITVPNGDIVPKYYTMKLVDYNKFKNSSAYREILEEVEEEIREEVEEELRAELEEVEVIEAPMVEEEIPTNSEKEKHIENLNTITSVDDNIFTQSNLSIEEVLHLLKGTRFEDNESVAQEIIKTESTYNVNAFVILGIAKLEAGYELDSNIAVNKNNLFGIYNSSIMEYSTFSSVERGIEFFGELMSGPLYKGSGLETLRDIQPRYCPPNTDWDNVVSELIERDFDLVEKFILDFKYIL